MVLRGYEKFCSVPREYTTPEQMEKGRPVYDHCRGEPRLASVCVCV